MRAKGEGSLTVERRAGRKPVYLARHSLPDGRRRARRFPFTKAGKEAAVAYLKKYGVGAAPAGSSSLSAYLDVWLDRVRGTVAPKTWKGYEQIIRVWLKPNLGKARLDRLSAADVEVYLHALPLHPQTVSHHRACLRKALADAERDGLVGRNVASMARPPTIPKDERKWLSSHDLERLFEATVDTRLHALWVLAGTAGLRSGELLALAWGDVDLDAGMLRVRHTLHRESGEWVFRATKTRQTRSVYLDDYAVWSLRQHRSRQSRDSLAAGYGTPEGLVFTTEHGQPYHAGDLSRLLKRELLLAGLPVVTLHSLRHSCASWLLESKTDINVIASILGHSTPAITAQLYTHIGEDLKRDAVRRLRAASK